MAVDRPDSIEDMHEQDWLIVIEALMEYGSPFTPGSEEFRGENLEDPRRVLAFELAGVFADYCEVPAGDLEDHIDPEWDGTGR